jgi:hypothetical protein
MIYISANKTAKTVYRTYPGDSHTIDMLSGLYVSLGGKILDLNDIDLDKYKKMSKPGIPQRIHNVTEYSFSHNNGTIKTSYFYMLDWKAFVERVELKDAPHILNSSIILYPNEI